MLSSPDNAEALVSFSVSLSYPSSHLHTTEISESPPGTGLTVELSKTAAHQSGLDSADPSACAYYLKGQGDTCYTEQLTLVSLGELTVQS